MNRAERRAREHGRSGKLRGPGSAQRMKERQLGLKVEGFSKPLLDAMNRECWERFKLGIGVVTQEELRARTVVESFDGCRWWRRLSVSRFVALRAARADLRLWEGRLKEVAAAVAESRSSR